MRYLITIILITLLTSSAMAKEIKTEILINASATKVWSILTDFENYPNWNPFIKSKIGNVKIGNKITTRIKPPETKEMTFKPKVLTYQVNKEFSWIGHLLFTGLFDGKHKFELIERLKNKKFKHYNEHIKLDGGHIAPLEHFNFVCDFLDKHLPTEVIKPVANTVYN